MDWTEVTVSVDAKDVDRAGDIAQMASMWRIIPIWKRKPGRSRILI